jgi:hypothetical protein
VAETKRESPLRRHKQTLQAGALVIMLVAPAGLYWAAEAGASGSVILLLGVMGATMGVLTLVR